MADLEGRVVLVTGVAHGIGWAILEAARSEGAVVYGADILEEDLRRRAEALGAPDRLRVVDVTRPADWNAWVAEVLGREGRIDALVNSAGGVAGQVHRPIEEVSDEDWRRVVEINLYGAFYGIRAVAPHMKARRTGAVVNISSGAGRSTSLTGIQAYTSAKAGQLGLTRQMAQELGPYGVRVNAICPGFVRSNPTTERQWEAMGEAGQRALLERIPLRRLGTAEEIADMTIVLLTDRARYVTGQVVSVDGGQQMF
ncbi:MAG: SDR family oxidoreductase [Firmicutes bacterium]|nr:SDR family oxidoreductase [Bacillota bacterium]